MKNSRFRTWVRELWYDNCEEHFQTDTPRYTHEEYFRNFKWWLKREFKHRENREKNGSKRSAVL